MILSITTQNVLLSFVTNNNTLSEKVPRFEHCYESIRAKHLNLFIIGRKGVLPSKSSSPKNPANFLAIYDVLMINIEIGLTELHG